MADAGVGEAAAAEGAKTAGEAVAAEGAVGAGAAAAGEGVTVGAGISSAAGGLAASSELAPLAAGVGAVGGGAALGGGGGATDLGGLVAGESAVGEVSSSDAAMGALKTFSGTPTGQAVISAGTNAAASTLLQAMMTPGGVKAPSVRKVNAMPTADSAEVMAAKKKSIVEQMRSRGRASTILTDKLG